MALTRKMLKAMGIEDEKIEQIIEAHTESVDALKQERDTYKEDADKLKGVQTELDDLKKSGGDWQKKYEDEHKAFETYKNDQTAKETLSEKQKAYRALLKEASISDKVIDSIVKITDFGGIEIGEDGMIKDAKERIESVKTEYADFVVAENERGANVTNPPAGRSGDLDLGSLSMKEYIAARKNK